MTNSEKQFLAALSKDRAENATMLEKPSMRGVKNSIVEKYSDQAHFIYELLQNADDAGATSARFILEKGRLIFAHNGTRNFSVSNPATEDEDSLNGSLGDINAITSIANSNKIEASIGKFGVGFKAVFQYTATPYIYDPKFRFRINRFIVPELLDDDFPDRRKNETLFVFPFDHADKTADEACVEILKKLKNLIYPTLFLNSLLKIRYEYEDVVGSYEKAIILASESETEMIKKIRLSQNNGRKSINEDLWLFTRKDKSENTYSVGYFLDAEGHLSPVNLPAFCFFPTKEATGLNFIIHAPFLLTDSREGIRAGIKHNNRMIQQLASLAADAIVILKEIGVSTGNRIIDDTIIKIIPIDKRPFSDPNDNSKISFLPVYNSIKKKFQSEEIIPTGDSYVFSKNAYWAAIPQLTKLFSDAQLAEICGNQNAKWAFASLGREEIRRNDSALFNYIDDITADYLSEDTIINGKPVSQPWTRVIKSPDSESIKGITASFIESQPIVWLHEFYKWLSETKGRTEMIARKPIFLDKDHKAIAAFDDNGEETLFLPADGMEECVTILPELLENPRTKAFVDQIGIKQPSLRDEIYNIILPRYKKDIDDPNSDEELDIDTDFLLFFKYYCKCPNEETENFIKLIKDYRFVTFYYDQKKDPYRAAANTMYFPTEDLKTFFSAKADARFVALDDYKKMVKKTEVKRLNAFLLALGVRNKPALELIKKQDMCNSKEEYVIDGLPELISKTANKRDAKLSVYLWNKLCELITDNTLTEEVLIMTCGSRQDGRYKFKVSYEESQVADYLRHKAWLFKQDSKFASSVRVTTSSISKAYKTRAPGASELITMLGIIDDSNNEKYLSSEQKKQIAFAKKCSQLGITENDISEILALKRQRETSGKQQSTDIKQKLSKVHSTNQSANSSTPTDDNYLQDANGNRILNGQTQDPEFEHTELSPVTSKVVKDIVRRTRELPNVRNSKQVVSQYREDVDQDEFTPAAVNYSEKIDRAKQKSAAEIEKIAHLENLQQTAMAATRYTFLWFKTLLEMETLNCGELNAESKEVSISFARVEREPGTQRTLILSQPSRYIPQFMEDLADIPLVLHMGEKTKKVAIEVTNIKSYTLRVKMKSNAEIDGIDLNEVTEATIEAQSPAFLMEELRKQFSDLHYMDDFDMQANLCENIEFIFGPPGTGKTTYLASNILLPLMQLKEDYKVLVLTPTNKAADVLVERIMEVSGTDRDYGNWLVRFGTTNDEAIEQSQIFKDKTFDIRSLARNVTVTTIARFPYDYFMPKDARIFLQGINWDYIVIDEASMIPIANIIYPLYKKTPKKFIIAGDPFQIEPITSVDIWKSENIYNLVHLDSFSDPKTTPHQYHIKLLTTQYRSIPTIGNIFSNFTYGGVLKHNRTAESQRPLNIDEMMDIKTLNIIKFPVSKYESIYRPKRLQHSSAYQVYSAIFTFEYVNYLSKLIAEKNKGSLFRIGIIAPYRAQADLIDKLISSEKLPQEVNVQVGTIHSFQGDECDIIFAVFNPPPYISTSKEMFLNKNNIINVSISRAKDYLFIIMPDDNTENVQNLKLVKSVERLIKMTGDFKEQTSQAIEQAVFGSAYYLENSAFSTSHQSVNVYGLPEKSYEIRTEESAVDVQVHRKNSI